MLAAMAASTGDALVFDSSTPGGYTLGNHRFNTTTLAKIQTGNWDHVVLQEQSQTYAFSSYFPTVFPNAIQLDSIIKAYNHCEQTIFYMTWGYKNGDSYLCTFPECDPPTTVYRTYAQMDSVIHTNYMAAGDSLNAIVSPVGAVWRYLRQNHPTLELYQADGSHPTAAGTYAAACAFYTAIYRKDPGLITYDHTLPATDASIIRNAAQQVVYNDILHWGIGAYDSLQPDSCLALGMDDATKQFPLHFYPNPAHDGITIESKVTSVQNIQLCNSLGIVVKDIRFVSRTYIDISSLPAGLYFLYNENDPTVLKLVKQ